MLRDNESQWKEVNDGLLGGSTRYIKSLAISGNTLFAGTHGSGVYSVPVYALLGISKKEKKSNIFKIYPNPCESKMVISSVENIQNFNIQILNLHGKEILTYHSNKPEPVEIDVHLIPKGVFLVKIQNEKMMEYQKLIIY